MKPDSELKKRFVIYFWFVSWVDISLGVSLDIQMGHVDIHIPFGFVRIGFEGRPTIPALNSRENEWRKRGLVR